jgi:hypothetical protein
VLNKPNELVCSTRCELIAHIFRLKKVFIATSGHLDPANTVIAKIRSGFNRSGFNRSGWSRSGFNDLNVNNLWALNLDFSDSCVKLLHSDFALIDSALEVLHLGVPVLHGGLGSLAAWVVLSALLELLVGADDVVLGDLHVVDNSLLEILHDLLPLGLEFGLQGSSLLVAACSALSASLGEGAVLLDSLVNCVLINLALVQVVEWHDGLVEPVVVEVCVDVHEGWLPVISLLTPEDGILLDFLVANDGVDLLKVLLVNDHVGASDIGLLDIASEDVVLLGGVR